MDFSNRTSQSASGPRLGSVFSPQDGGSNQTKETKEKPNGKKLRGLNGNKWLKGSALIVLFGTGLLALALIGWLITARSNQEASFVNKDKLQAVFLTNNQVYFGKISSMQKNYMVLNNIYYLQQQGSTTSSSTNSGNISLIKLGCELHKPYDQMVINRSEVEFWENLQSDGQVATAVKSYQSQNSGSQKCSTTNGAASNVQGSATTDSSATNANANADTTSTGTTDNTNNTTNPTAH